MSKPICGQCQGALGEVSEICPVGESGEHRFPSPFAGMDDEVLAEAVDHPKHYAFGKFEVIDVLEDWQLGFHLGNTVKYIARAGRKGDALEDLKKARWYLDREISRREKASGK